MNHHDRKLSEFSDILRAKYGDRLDQFLVPPPIFELMQGEFLAIDLETGTLTARFPILPSYRNPYGLMQGGMIAAAVDNAIGPLSFLVAPPNVTRHLELKYSQGVTLELEQIIVTARLVERKDPQLFFAAEVRSPDGVRLARAKAVHWIIN